MNQKERSTQPAEFIHTTTSTQANDMKQRYKAGLVTLRKIGKAIRLEIHIAQVFAVLSACLVWVPYWALLNIGQLLFVEHYGAASPEVSHYLMLLMAGYVGHKLLYTIALFITHLADLKLRRSLKKQILDQLSHLPLAWIAKNGSGPIRKIVQDDVVTIHTLVAHAPVDIAIAILNPLALFIFAAIINWRLALVAIATIPLYALFYALSARGMTEKTVELDQKLKTLTANMVEFINGIAVVRAFGRNGKALQQYLDSANDFINFYKAWTVPNIRAGAFSSVWISIPMLLFVNFGLGYLVVQGNPAYFLQVAVTSVISLMLPEALSRVVGVLWSYQLAGAASLRLDEHFSQPILHFVSPQESMRPKNSRVVFSHVSFSYQDNQVLHDINLTLEPSSVTALIGPSGSGKTTLATLLARFQDPQSGSITIGDVPLTQLDQHTLYGQVAFVLQDAQLLQISIRDNIALAVPGASQSAIESAAKAAYIHEEIMSLPKGYDTIFGIDTKLSGGQEQRIAIARALLQDAPILILDEATAMADPESEAEIQRALNRLIRGRTVLVVAHRVASIKGADQIVILNRGHIEAAGTHKDLLQNKHYQTLIAQSSSTPHMSKGYCHA